LLQARLAHDLPQQAMAGKQIHLWKPGARHRGRSQSARAVRRQRRKNRPPVPTAVSAPPTSTHDLPTLAAVDLSCRRGNRILFKGLNLEVRSGQATWLRGRNGRGKTSLLRVAAGLSVPEAGQMLWDGKAVRRSASYQRAMVFIGHANALKDDLSATESLQFLARMHERDSRIAALHAALDRVGMVSRRDAMVRTLSQGQRRRVALARLALERQAALWLLDEPYDALDTEGIARINGLLREHLGRGGSAMLTSHQHPGADAPAMTEFDLDTLD
jgi:heme exporter protein A